MSYQVLARKWRPRSFATLVGQEHVVRALVNGLESGRLHHAFLFSGTRGIGKTTIARILAKALNCEAGVSAQPCGECDACRDVDDGRFVDLIEVDAASRTKVEQTRELLDNVQYAPTRGRYKVYLIDEVHMLSTHSFNALLKTLEEPPPHVKFLLATTDPQRLPATILSRCLQFNLKRLPPQPIAQHFQTVLEAESIEAEEAALRLLAEAADGSLRDGLSLLDQAIAYGGGTVREDDVRGMLGLIEPNRVQALARALAEGDGAALLSGVEALADAGRDCETALGELTALWHRVALAQTVPEVARHRYDDAELLALAESVSAEEVQLFYQIGLMGQKDMALATDPRSALEMVLLRMLAFRPSDAPPTPAPSQAAAKPAGKPQRPRAAATAGDAPASAARPRAKSASSPGPGAALAAQLRAGSTPKPESPRPEPPAPPQSERCEEAALPPYSEPEPATEAASRATDELPADSGAPDTKAAAALDVPVAPVDAPVATDPPASSPDDADALPDERDWAAMVARLGLKGMVHQVAANCTVLAREGDTLRLRLDPSCAQLRNSRVEARLQEALAAYYGQNLKVTLEVGELPGETPMQQERREAAERQQEAEQAIQQDSGVAALREAFGAQVTPDSVRPLDSPAEDNG